MESIGIYSCAFCDWFIKVKLDMPMDEYTAPGTTTEERLRKSLEKKEMEMAAKIKGEVDRHNRMHVDEMIQLPPLEGV